MVVILEERRMMQQEGGQEYPEEGVLNIMSDRRVVRGSTYSLYRAVKPSAEEAHKRRQRTKIIKRREVKATTNAAREKVSLRKEDPVDLTPFLIEKKIPKKECEVAEQTDAFREEPPPPQFVPSRKAPPQTDASTSMAEEQPFSFDLEVVPLLETLVSKTLEEAISEIHRESELAAIHADQQVKLAAEHAEAERIRNLEIEEAKCLQVKQQEIEQAHIARQHRIELQRKIASRDIVTNSILPNIIQQNFDLFLRTETWVDPLIREIRAEVLPSLYENVELAHHRHHLATQLVDDLIRSICPPLPSLKD